MFGHFFAGAHQYFWESRSFFSDTYKWHGKCKIVKTIALSCRKQYFAELFSNIEQNGDYKGNAIPCMSPWGGKIFPGNGFMSGTTGQGMVSKFSAAGRTIFGETK